MQIKELRKIANLTQKEAAELIGMPLRTYSRYENTYASEKNFKSEMIKKFLENLLKIDEENGLLTKESIIEVIKPIFEKNNISFAYLFGSYAKGYAKENSDVDILISGDITGLKYFGLVEELRESLKKKIDLIKLEDVNENADFLKEIMKDGIKIYG